MRVALPQTLVAPQLSLRGSHAGLGGLARSDFPHAHGAMQQFGSFFNLYSIGIELIVLYNF